jgi:hypothetical protein
MATNYLVTTKSANLFGEKQIVIKGVTKIEIVKKKCMLVRFELTNGLAEYFKANGIESIEVYEV